MRLRASRQRSAISETCAIVNDSIAPNAYSVPRNSACPGIITMQAMRAEHGDRRRPACGTAG